MKILEVVHNFLPDNIGGTEVYTYNISKEFKKLGHDTRVFTHYSSQKDDEYNSKEYQYNGIPVHSINYNFKDLKNFSGFYRNDLIDNKFKKYLPQFDPDIIHFQHLTCLSVNLINIARDSGYPAIATIADYWYLCQRGQLIDTELQICESVNPEKCVNCYLPQLRALSSDRISGLKKKTKSGFLKKLGKKILSIFPGKSGTDYKSMITDRLEFITSTLNRLNLILAPSKFLKNMYILHGINPDLIVYSDYGFDPGFEFKNFDKIKTPIKFGFIGTIIPTKGLHIVVESFRQLKSLPIEFHVHGIAYNYPGFEDYYSKLIDNAKGLNITFHGEFQNNEVNNILQNLDLLIVPSIWFENSPLTIHEAFLSGIPVITSDKGGMAELVKDGVTGFQFKLGDSRSLSEIIRKLSDNPDIILELNKNIKNEKIKTLEQDAEGIIEKIKQIKAGN